MLPVFGAKIQIEEVIETLLIIDTHCFTMHSAL